MPESTAQSGYDNFPILLNVIRFEILLYLPKKFRLAAPQHISGDSAQDAENLSG